MNPSYPQIEFTFTFFLDGMTILYYILISQVSLIGQVGLYFLIIFKTERFLCVK